MNARCFSSSFYDHSLSVLVCVFFPMFSLQAKVDNEILDYRNLAAIPRVKAIYDIERPDLINYEPLYTTSLDEMEERESVGEVNLPQHFTSLYCTIYINYNINHISLI